MHHLLSPGRFALAVVLATLGGCKSATDAPPAGAFVLKVSLAPGARMPDELRASIYDDTGALWKDARFPASGQLTPESAGELGTILIQPGSVSGDLRVDLRGLTGGALADEATLKIPHASFSGATFDLALSVPIPPDADGDGVPDPIDDCPTTPDPPQTGCPADAGTDAPVSRSDAGRDAAAPGRDAGADLPPPPPRDAGQDAPARKANGAACGAAGECASGFCKDGACCNNACGNPCETCSTGSCIPVKNGPDDPECMGPMTCNKAGKCVAASGG